jgi:Ser/Thr protein kinase RdoA (MazF antagonist)
MPTLASIVRAFGVEPDAIRLISRRQNAHWAIRAGSERYVLRRFGVWAQTEGDADWELDAVARLAAAGAAVPRAIGGVRVIAGARYLMLPWIGGRRLADPPVSDADYEHLGEFLADFHARTDPAPSPPQRPGWTSCVDGAFPAEGGAARRGELLAELAKVDAGMAARFGEAAAALQARDLPAIFAGHPCRIVHGDFSPWNIRVRGGQLAGVIDFDLAHLDVRAADVAWARRGYHDGVVRGYQRRMALTDAELANLDALWTGGSLRGVWRVLEGRLAEGRLTTHGFDWNLDQLGKTRPYRG